MQNLLPRNEFFVDDTANNNDVRPVHIRIQQRNNKKSWTTVEGIHSDFDLKKILKKLKGYLVCGGTIVVTDDSEVLQFQGDHRDKISTFLVDQGICLKSQIVIHGGW